MRILIASLLLAVPVPALAQPARAADVGTMATDDCAKAREAGNTCVLSITNDDDIIGSAPTYGETGVALIGFGGHGSLIKLRMDFIQEILRTAEDIE